MLISMNSKIWQPAHTAKSTNTGFNNHGIIVLDWPATLNPEQAALSNKASGLVEAR